MGHSSLSLCYAGLCSCSYAGGFGRLLPVQTSDRPFRNSSQLALHRHCTQNGRGILSANACYQELSWLRFVSEVQRGHWTGSIGRCRSSCCYRSRYSISNANRMDGEHRVWASGLCVASSLARMLAAHHHRWWSEFDGTRRNVLANHALRVSTGRSMSENAWSRHLGLHSRAIQCTYRSAES